MIQYLSLADFLIIAEAVLGIPAEDLYRTCDIGVADSALKAPVLTYRLSRNHPLLDGNKRVAYLALREFVARNGYSWTAPEGDDPHGDETVKVMWDVAAGHLTEKELTDWVAERIGEAT